LGAIRSGEDANQSTGFNSLLYIVLRKCLLCLYLLSFVLIVSVCILLQRNTYTMGGYWGNETIQIDPHDCGAHLFVFISLPGGNHGALRGFGIGLSGVNDPRSYNLTQGRPFICL
jgi:hypothetical protein